MTQLTQNDAARGTVNPGAPRLPARATCDARDTLAVAPSRRSHEPFVANNGARHRRRAPRQPSLEVIGNRVFISDGHVSAARGRVIGSHVFSARAARESRRWRRGGPAQPHEGEGVIARNRAWRAATRPASSVAGIAASLRRQPLTGGVLAAGSEQTEASAAYSAARWRRAENQRPIPEVRRSNE
jgi:hypothetical protein